MQTFTKTRPFAAAVGLLALAHGLPRAEARTTHGDYYVAYQHPRGGIVHTEAAKSPAAALKRFRNAALSWIP